MCSALSDHDLRQLPLRALVACAARAAMRIQKYVDPSTSLEGGRLEKPEDINALALLVVQTFCREGLNKPSILSAIAEDGRWSQNSGPAGEGDRAIETGEHAYSAAMGAEFGEMVFNGVATSSTARDVVEKATRAIEVALSTADGECARRRMEYAIRCDYEKLLDLRLGTFPEVGDFVEPSESGPLGPLWPEDITCQISRTRPLSVPKVGAGDGSSVAPNEWPASVFKYVSMKALLLILSSGQILCSPPISFNDPFDCQMHTVYRFGRKQLVESLRSEISMISSSDNPIGDSSVAQKSAAFIVNMPRDLTFALAPAGKGQSNKRSDASKLLRAFVVLASHKVISWESVEDVVKLCEGTEFSLVDFDAERRVLEYIAKTLRVFCASEAYDNVLMWSHYADLHRGAVIELRLRVCPETSLGPA